MTATLTQGEQLVALIRRRKERGLSKHELWQLTNLGYDYIHRLLKPFRDSGELVRVGHGDQARYRYVPRAKAVIRKVLPARRWTSGLSEVPRGPKRGTALQ